MNRGRTETACLRSTVAVVTGDTWIRDRLQRKKTLDTLTDALTSTWGEGTTWRLVEVEAGSQTDPESDASDPAVTDPRVQAVLDIFGGSVESVEETD